VPRPKSEFEGIYPCEFYDPDELLDGDEMYTIGEIARLLQGLNPDADVDEGTEAVIVDWAVPWVMVNADELVVGEPPTDDDPGYYGLQTE
jgi:hypothetical protein